MDHRLVSVVLASLSGSALDDFVYSEDHLGGLMSGDNDLHFTLERFCDSKLLHGSDLPVDHVETEVA